MLRWFFIKLGDFGCVDAWACLGFFIFGDFRGGERGIRTPGPSYPSRFLSKEVHSATLPSLLSEFSSGGRGIRTPGEFPHNGFQDRRLKPLGHPSVST